MLADNTPAFNCRLVPGTTVWSQHAYGLAVDINPFENPKSATAPSTLPPRPPGLTGPGRARR
jgi:hypothetical protein